VESLTFIQPKADGVAVWLGVLAAAVRPAHRDVEEVLFRAISSLRGKMAGEVRATCLRRDASIVATLLSCTGAVVMKRNMSPAQLRSLLGDKGVAGRVGHPDCRGR